MEDDSKKSTIELTKILNQSAKFFLVKHLEKLDDAPMPGMILEVINIIFSAHVSSLYSLLLLIAEENDDIKKSVQLFLDRLLEFISKQHIVEVWKPNDRT